MGGYKGVEIDTFKQKAVEFNALPPFDWSYSNEQATFIARLDASLCYTEPRNELL